MVECVLAHEKTSSPRRKVFIRCDSLAAWLLSRKIVFSIWV